MNEKKHHNDLLLESKHWKPYEQCSKLEYRNQEFRVKYAIIELIKDVCLFSVIKNDNIMLEQEMLMISYKRRCCAEESKIVEDTINKKLKVYCYLKDGNLEDFIIKNIPRNCLKPFYALNMLGLEWEEKQYQEASIYIQEMCQERYGNLDLDVLGDLEEKMISELEKYEPNLQELGAFISSRMNLRLKDVKAKKDGIRKRKRIIKEDAIILIDSIMEVGSIHVVNMEKVEEVLYENLKKGTYAISKNKIFFSKEDIGETVVIRYKQNMRGVADIVDAMKRGGPVTNRFDIDTEQMLVKFVARFLNYQKVYSGKRIMVERERRQLCFTEKLVRLIKKGYRKDKTLEVDAINAVKEEYLDFFMSELCERKVAIFFKMLRNTRLKDMCDIVPSETEKEELKWNGAGWLSAKVPIAYFDTIEQKKVANSTVSEFRKAYNEWLADSISSIVELEK